MTELLRGWVLPCLYSSLASLGFGIFFNLHGRKLVSASLGGGLGWLAFLLVAPLSGDISQYFLATVAISIYAETMARFQHAPVTVYLAPALIPLVPGGGIYQSMVYALNGQSEEFLTETLHTLTIAGALAIGLVITSSVIRLLLRSDPRRRS
ncbi:MAG: threonine/serine exporter family protein [Oscillospiraceae bacterium]